MKIKSNLLRAALVCTNKYDSRRALHGIHITQQYVEASDGCVAVRMSHDAIVEQEVLLKLTGSVPVRAETTEFRLGKEPFAIHYDQDGIRIGVCSIEHICDDEFPDIEKAMPTEKEDDVTPAFNILYLAYFLRMFGDRYLHGVKFHYFGERRPCLVRFSRKCCEDYGNPVFLLMPMIQEHGEYPDE